MIVVTVCGEEPSVKADVPCLEGGNGAKLRAQKIVLLDPAALVEQAEEIELDLVALRSLIHRRAAGKEIEGFPADRLTERL